MRKAKIICTLGPATSEPQKILELIEAGMDCARLNFSHGSYSDHEASFNMIREASLKAGRPVAILQDLQGPKIRVGSMRNGSAMLETGTETVITTQSIEGTSKIFQTDYEGFAKDVKTGDAVLLDDGLISLEVLSVSGDEVKCRVVHGGILHERKGINLPGSSISIGVPTDKDLNDLEFGLKLGVDFVALSFVQNAEDILKLKRRMKELDGRKVPVIAKIERPLAVLNLEEIIRESDGLMIARGDLGIEMPAEKVPGIQKNAVERAGKHGKPVIIATQMLDSMTRMPRPTRAEVSDVANAIYDGADALMLSGETAVGAFPMKSAHTMAGIIREVENSPRYKAGIDRSFKNLIPTFRNATARAAVNIASDLGLEDIVVFTESGLTAARISQYRPCASITAFSPSSETLRRMALFWGVHPQPIERLKTTDQMFLEVSRYLLSRGICKKGNSCVIVAGVPPDSNLPANLIKLHLLEDK